jgi:hypothetical protein
MGEDS